MKYYLLNIFLAVVAVFVIAGCSDLETDIPQQPSISVHKEGIANPASNNFHGKIIKANNWNMKNCQSCHAADFSGGVTGTSCKTCHTEPQGPLACNTCHGNFSKPNRIAPPKGINGDTARTYRGVGAHTQHLYNNILGNAVECSSCHNVPSGVYVEGHLDSGLPAEVGLKGLAVNNIADNANYNADSLTCSNTYCHGNFEFSKADADPTNQFIYTADKIVGNNKTVKWTGDSSEAECGSCHGLPPLGHLGYQQFPINQCVACHPGVVDENGNIINKSKHINGVKNSRGE